MPNKGLVIVFDIRITYAFCIMETPVPLFWSEEMVKGA